MNRTTDGPGAPNGWQGPTNIGDRIRSIRGDERQEDFARQVGVHANTLARYEKNERSPDASILEAICRYRPRLNPSWLLTGEGAPWRDEVREDRSAYVAERKELDEQLLTDIIEAVEQVLRERKLELVPAKKARLIIELYDRFSEKGGGIDRATLLRLVDLAA